MLKPNVTVSEDIDWSDSSKDEDDHSVASSLSEHSDETYNETVSDPGSFANESSDDSVEDENLTGTQGLANVFAKILKKQVPKQSNVILSKAKTDKERLRKKQKESGENVEEQHKEKMQKIDKKRAWENMGRKKPSVLEKDKERSLQRIATRGVVQLFNAVKKQQSNAQDIVENTKGERRKDQALKEKVTKGAFMDLLRKAPKKQTNPHNAASEFQSGLSNGGDAPTWSVLKDDFAMKAKTMKDWSRDDAESDAEMDLT